MRSKFSLYVLALIVAAFSLAIAGCGDDDGGGGGGGEKVSGQSLDQRRLDRPGGDGRSTPCSTASSRNNPT